MDMRGISPLELLAFPPIFLELRMRRRTLVRETAASTIYFMRSRGPMTRETDVRDPWHVRLAAGCGVAPPSQKPHMQRDAQATQLHAEVSRLAAYPPFLPLAL